MKHAASILALAISFLGFACSDGDQQSADGAVTPMDAQHAADASPHASDATNLDAIGHLDAVADLDAVSTDSGTCPADYVGDLATGCIPILIALGLSSGTLTPALASGVYAYAVDIGLQSQTITLTPTVSAGATITINGQPVVSGQSWTSPVLSLGDTVIDIVVTHDGHSSHYTIRVTRGHQDAYLKASNTNANDSFGDSMAIDGDTIVIGAPGESSAATRINGNQADNTAPGAGAAYVFVRTGTTWAQQAYLKASNAQAGDAFGYWVAISGDTIVVTANGEDSNAVGVGGDQSNNSAVDSGAAYVFTRTGTVWTQQAYLKASNTDAGDLFGTGASISGNTLVISAEDEASGASGVDGNQADNSVTGAGAAYVFVRNGTAWTQQAYLKASNPDISDGFGWKCTLSGDTIVVAGWGEDSDTRGINGPQGVNENAFASGAAYVFTRSGTIWSQQAYLKPSDTEADEDFGHSLWIDGDTLVVGAAYESSSSSGVNGEEFNIGAHYSGAAFVFTRTGTIWSQQAYLKSSNPEHDDHFGWSVALSGNRIAVGASEEASHATGINGDQSDNSAPMSGAAYLFTRTGTIWSQQAYLKASNTDSMDYFGRRIAMSGGTVVVGAYGEASRATGYNGDQADNSAPIAGAAYVFR